MVPAAGRVAASSTRQQDGRMSESPPVVVLDVNETLSDLAPLASRFADVGAPEHLARLWFAGVLRDGFALTIAGASRPFAQIGAGVLRTLLLEQPLQRPVDEAVDHVMSGFLELPVHPDVPDGLRRLRAAGVRVVTLSNGSVGVAEALLDRAGVRDQLEALLSVEDAGAWKPTRAAYEYAARRCGVEPHEMVLVAVHPWDLDGAARAGLRTAWVDRSGAGRAGYPDYLTAPDLTVTGLDDLAAQLAG
jgi:2-haloacid dehalogenase